MRLKRLDYDLTVCKVGAERDIDLGRDFLFVGKTDEELSLVCRTEDTPQCAVEREDGWKGFRVEGTLDFSLIGVLAELSGILARHKIGIFVVSTFNTDYILTKKEQFDRALDVLSLAGHDIS